MTQKIGSGMTSEIFALENHRVVKLFYQHIPKDWVDYEYNLAGLVGELYQSAPRAFEMVDLDGRPGIIYERALGEEVSQILQRESHRAEEFGHAMAILHGEMHGINAEELPNQKDRYILEIEESRVFLGNTTDSLIEQLSRLNSGDSICHGDFHLGNILFDKVNYRVIDWMNACKGNPLADVNRTLLMLETPYSLETVAPNLKPMVQEILTQVKNSYLTKYIEITGVILEDILQWRPIVAAARLKEDVPGEKDWLLEMI